MAEQDPQGLNDQASTFSKLYSWVINSFNKNILYFWTSFWIITTILIGLRAVYIFSNTKNIDYGVVVVWAIGYFLLGVLVGCICGVPKVMPNSSGTPNPPTASTTENRTTASMKGPTNLTDISDWLSKIVVGAGLVELNKIPGFVLKVAGKMALGINLTASGNSQILCSGIIVYYTCLGLIAGYFMMRSILIRFMEM